MIKPITHFVGFTDGDRYHNAIKVFGPPHYVHPGWDLRALRDIHPGDTVVFATGNWTDPPRTKSFKDMEGV